MRAIRSFFFLSALLWLGGLAFGDPLTHIKVTAEGVNLRAAPDTNCETVGQVSKGTVLTVVSEEGEWIGVVPPRETEVWIFGGLVRDGAVAGSHVKVRCGPGINYTAVGEVNRPEKVEIRGEFNNWFKVAPPPGSATWINRMYVVNADSAQSVAPADAAPPIQNAHADAPPAVVAPAPHSAVTILAPSTDVKPVAAGSGAAAIVPGEAVRAPTPAPAPVPHAPGARLSEWSGILKSAGMLMRKHARYRLVRPDPTGRLITVCGLDGDGARLAEFLDRSVRVSGEERLPQGSRWPIVKVHSVLPQ